MAADAARLMFERLLERTRRAAERRAEAEARALAERLDAELPPGIAARVEAEGVVLSGRAIARRFALEPELRWLIGRLT
ncbi:MAG TPA: hypothetical protein VGE84_09325 [Allosphingosinicella sp.]